MTALPLLALLAREADIAEARVWLRRQMEALDDLHRECGRLNYRPLVRPQPRPAEGLR